MKMISPTNAFAVRVRPWWAAARLGWAIESNWTDPFVFLTYQIVRPLFGALILVVMFKVVAGRLVGEVAFAQIYVGNAFFIFVVQMIGGLGLVVIEDRERYQMIRYVYLSPLGLGTYLVARASGRLAATALSMLVTLIVGVWWFGVHGHLTLGQLPLFVVMLLLGMAATLALGVMLAGTTLVLAHHGWSMPEGVTGVLYLLCGVVFSIDILPGPLAAMGRLLPWTWWLEGLRRVWLGEPFNGSLRHFSDGQVLLWLIVSTAVVTVLAWVVLRGAEHLAVATGKLDQRTDH
ncbi:MAG: ABC transporter permease [Candidatus Zixiibacteriota bacterium]